MVRGWTAWLLWTLGVLLRWASGFYHFYWRALLPISAVLELAGFAKIAGSDTCVKIGGSVSVEGGGSARR